MNNQVPAFSFQPLSFQQQPFNNQEQKNMFNFGQQSNKTPIQPLFNFSQPMNNTSQNQPMNSIQSMNDFTSQQQDPLDDLTNAFSKMNIAGGCFSEIFLHFFKTQPNTMVNFIPSQYVKILEGTTKFNSKYERDFVKQVQLYNAMPYGKYLIECKKENSSNIFEFYNCTYHIRFVTKNNITAK